MQAELSGDTLCITQTGRWLHFKQQGFYLEVAGP